MSRRKAAGRRRGTPAERRKKPVLEAWRKRTVLGAVAAVALLAAAGVLATRRPRPAAPRAPFESMDADEALAGAAESMRTGRTAAGLPLLRRAAAHSSEFRLHRELARTLYAAGYERDAQGALRQRSSVERVGLMKEAIVEMGIANGLRVPGAERASAFIAFAEMMLDWGFPWESFVLYRKAEAAEPERKIHAARAQSFMTLLEYPHRFSLESVPVRAPEEARR